MVDNIKRAFEVKKSRIAMRIVKEAIENVYTVDCNEQQQGVKKLIKSIVGGVLNDSVEKSLLDDNFVHDMDELANSTCCRNKLTHLTVGSTFFISQTVRLVKKQVDRILEKVSFGESHRTADTNSISANGE